MIPMSRAQIDEWLRTLHLCAHLLAPQANQEHYQRIMEVIRYVQYQQNYLYPLKEVPAPMHALSGRTAATPGAIAAFERTGENPTNYLHRHICGDWGDVCKADKKANDRALTTGERVLSAYHLLDGTKVWIITEADRSVTTLLLPEEY